MCVFGCAPVFLCVCMRELVFLYVCACVILCVRVHVFMFACVFFLLCECVLGSSGRTFICMSVWAFMFPSIQSSVCVFVWVCVRACVCEMRVCPAAYGAIEFCLSCRQPLLGAAG